jgi:hypothetical protein
MGKWQGRIEGTTKKSELPSFLKKFDSRFLPKSELPMTYQEFSDHLSQKMPKRSGEGREQGFEKSTDRRDKTFEIENNRQTVVSVQDATIKRAMIQIRCHGEHHDGVL